MYLLIMKYPNCSRLTLLYQLYYYLIIIIIYCEDTVFLISRRKDSLMLNLIINISSNYWIVIKFQLRLLLSINTC